MPKKLLVAAANHWTSPFQVGSHELTRQFLKDGWQVGFISDPVSLLHLFNINNKPVSERFRINRTGGEFYNNQQLWAYVPFAVFSPQNFPGLRSKFLYRNWNRLTIPNVIKKITETGFDNVDLIYCDSILSSYLLEEINFKKSVFRIADNSAGFNKYSKNSSFFETRLAETTDLVVYSAKNLEEYVSRFNTKQTLYLPNGVDFEHFFKGPKELPTEFLSIPSPRVVYIGSMDYWFDVELINYAAEKLKNVSFVLIGNSNQIKNKVSKVSNLYLLGFKPYNEIPRYLHNSDAGIIPFKTKEYTELINSINPLKLYQYMACRLPVIASRWKELENLNSPALLYNSAEELTEKLSIALEQQQDKNALIEYAKKQDWKERYLMLTKTLNL